MYPLALQHAQQPLALEDQDEVQLPQIQDLEQRALVNERRSQSILTSKHLVLFSCPATPNRLRFCATRAGIIGILPRSRQHFRHYFSSILAKKTGTISTAQPRFNFWVNMPDRVILP